MGFSSNFTQPRFEDSAIQVSLNFTTRPIAIYPQMGEWQEKQSTNGMPAVAEPLAWILPINPQQQGQEMIENRTDNNLPTWRLADEQMYVLHWHGEEWAVQLVSGRWLVWHFEPGMPIEPEYLSRAWRDEWQGMPCVSHHATCVEAQGSVMAQLYERSYDNVVAFRPPPSPKFEAAN